MRLSRCLMAAGLAGAVFAGQACTRNAADTTDKDVGVARDASKAEADRALDATKDAGGRTADIVQTAGDRAGAMAAKVAEKTKDVVGKSQDAASAAGAAVTDGWITTKVKAKFADETLLKDSAITVDTHDHAVTLKGSVRTVAAKTRAAEIASGTKGVTRVVNHLVVN